MPVASKPSGQVLTCALSAQNRWRAKTETPTLYIGGFNEPLGLEVRVRNPFLQHNGRTAECNDSPVLPNWPYRRSFP